MNRQRATAVILENRKVLLFHRVRGGKEYEVFPGGGVEAGETYEDALVREVKEELTLDVITYELIATLRNLPAPAQSGFETNLLDTNVFLVTNYHGVPELGGPEKEKMTPDNQYIIEWIAVETLPLLPDIYPQGIVDVVLKHLNSQTS